MIFPSSSIILFLNAAFNSLSSNAFITNIPATITRATTTKTIGVVALSAFFDDNNDSSPKSNDNNEDGIFDVPPGSIVDLSRMDILGSDYSNEFTIDEVMKCHKPGMINPLNGKLIKKAQVILSMGPNPEYRDEGKDGSPKPPSSWEEIVDEDNWDDLAENEYAVKSGTRYDRTRMYIIDLELSHRYEAGTVIGTINPGTVFPDGSTMELANVIISSGPNGDWKPDRNKNRMEMYDDSNSDPYTGMNNGNSLSRGQVPFSAPTLGPPGGPGRQNDGYIYGSKTSKKRARRPDGPPPPSPPEFYDDRIMMEQRYERGDRRPHHPIESIRPSTADAQFNDDRRRGPPPRHEERRRKISEDVPQHNHDHGKNSSTKKSSSSSSSSSSNDENQFGKVYSFNDAEEEKKRVSSLSYDNEYNDSSHRHPHDRPQYPDENHYYEDQNRRGGRRRRHDGGGDRRDPYNHEHPQDGYLIGGSGPYGPPMMDGPYFGPDGRGPPPSMMDGHFHGPDGRGPPPSMMDGHFHGPDGRGPPPSMMDGHFHGPDGRGPPQPMMDGHFHGPDGRGPPPSMMDGHFHGPDGRGPPQPMMDGHFHGPDGRGPPQPMMDGHFHGPDGRGPPSQMMDGHPHHGRGGDERKSPGMVPFSSDTLGPGGGYNGRRSNGPGYDQHSDMSSNEHYHGGGGGGGDYNNFMNPDGRVSPGMVPFSADTLGPRRGDDVQYHHHHHGPENHFHENHGMMMHHPDDPSFHGGNNIPRNDGYRDTTATANPPPLNSQEQAPTTNQQHESIRTIPFDSKQYRKDQTRRARKQYYDQLGFGFEIPKVIEEEEEDKEEENSTVESPDESKEEEDFQ